MATLRKERKLAALNNENCEEPPRSNLAQNSNVPRSQEEYTTQVSEEIEVSVTKMLSQEFSRTENHMLCALSRLEDFLMNRLIQGHSGTAPETSRNACGTNQGTKEDDPGVILILKQVSSGARRHETMAQKTATTWCQEFTAKSHTAPPKHLPESKKRTTLPFKCNYAVRIPLQK